MSVVTWTGSYLALLMPKAWHGASAQLSRRFIMDELSVQDVMTTGPTTLKRNEKLTLTDDIMQLRRIRHLPAIDDDE
jgi:CBS domain-containing protein